MHDGLNYCFIGRSCFATESIPYDTFYCSFSAIGEILIRMDGNGLDDLFGDAPSIPLPEPMLKGLPQRVDELSLNGCCQYVTDLGHSQVTSKDP